jgi:hypothetical protein
MEFKVLLRLQVLPPAAVFRASVQALEAGTGGRAEPLLETLYGRGGYRHARYMEGRESVAQRIERETVAYPTHLAQYL